MDEVKILKSMRHVSPILPLTDIFTITLQPCIIRIEDMYDTMDTLYIVLEL